MPDSRWEHRCLAWDRLPDPLTALEVEQLFALEPSKLACAMARRTPLHRLAVALRMVFLKTTGRPLNSVEIALMLRLDRSGEADTALQR